jgi:hypothetical protein
MRGKKIYKCVAGKNVGLSKKGLAIQEKEFPILI